MGRKSGSGNREETEEGGGRRGDDRGRGREKAAPDLQRQRGGHTESGPADGGSPENQKEERSIKKRGKFGLNRFRPKKNRNKN